MAKIPSIKGSIVANHAEVLQKFLAKANVPASVLARRFEPGDLELLAGPIEAIRWYDIRLYERLLEFLRDYDGEGSNQYLIEAGRRSAENLIRAGIHQKPGYTPRTQHKERIDAAERSAAFGRDLRLLSSITGSILNFSEVTVLQDPEHRLRWMLQRADARHFPEVLCWTT